MGVNVALNIKRKKGYRITCCKRCLRYKSLKIGMSTCKRCLTLKAKEVLGTGPKPFWSEVSLQDRLDLIPVARIIPKIPVKAKPVPLSMRVIHWIDRHDSHLLIGFWIFLLSLAIYF